MPRDLDFYFQTIGVPLDIPKKIRINAHDPIETASHFDYGRCPYRVRALEYARTVDVVLDEAATLL